MRPIESAIHAKLTQHFAPEHLELTNESPMHGLKPEAEKHFRVVVVSIKFSDLSRVERHRAVHDVLKDELKTHVHALSVQAYTPQEWQKRAATAHQSPECLGGGKREGVGR